MRPKQPKFTDHTDPDSYYNLNKYYNEAEKIFDKIESYVRTHLQLHDHFDDYDMGKQAVASYVFTLVTKGRE